MWNRLYLVRHGENAANLTKEFSYRQVDCSLTAKGVLQAQRTAAYFTDRTIHAIYASPLKRAVETADILARVLHLPVVILEHFREVWQDGTVAGELIQWASVAHLHGEAAAVVPGVPERALPLARQSVEQTPGSGAK